MVDLSGKWFIDGIDLFATFKLFIEEGSADFLKFPPKKASIEHDWMDSHGREVDLSRVFLDQREGVLEMAIIATNRDDFFQKQSDFITHMTQPGKRRFEIDSHGNRSYYIYYKECNNFRAVKALTGSMTGYFAYRFSLVVVEPEPQAGIAGENVFLIDEDNRFIVT